MSDISLTPLDPLSKPMGFKFVSLGELSDEQKQVLKDTVAQGTTDTQLTYFLNVALSQDLDPFKKEVWCILYNGKLTIQTGRDGLLKIAKRDPTFDRIQSAEVREGDDFRMDAITGQIEHRLTTKRGAILGAWAMITRKDGVKLTKYVTFSEYYDGSSPVWKEYPTPLICKCAESVLCKQFANVTGIVAEETIRRDGVVIDSSPTAQAQQSSLKDDLVRQIEACTTLEEFAKLRDTIAGSVGKLFGPEKDAVYAAAKAKKAELESLDPSTRPNMSGKVVNHQDGDPTNSEVSNLEIVDGPPPAPAEPPQSLRSMFTKPVEAMPDDEFATWLESIKAQETAQGVDDVLKAASEKPLSEPQRAQLAEAAEAAKEALQPKKSAKKKAA